MRRLAHHDLVDAIADAGYDDSQQLGETRIDAGAQKRGSAAFTRCGQAIAVGTEAFAVDEGSGGDDVDAGSEDADEFVDRGPHRVVDHTIGIEREELVHVAGRCDADGVDAAEFACVSPLLLG